MPSSCPSVYAPSTTSASRNLLNRNKKTDKAMTVKKHLKKRPPNFHPLIDGPCVTFPRVQYITRLSSQPNSSSKVHLAEIFGPLFNSSMRAA